MNASHLFRTLAIAMLLAGACLPVYAQHLDLAPTADGFATRTDPLGAFTTLDTSSENVLTENRTEDFNENLDFQESRGIFEFDISAIPTNATITGVTFNADEVGAGATIADGPRPLLFYGYAGDGVAETGDATAGSLITILSGGFDTFTLGPQSVHLDPSAVQSVLGVSAFFGIDTRMDVELFNGISLASSRNTLFPHPDLAIDYTIPRNVTPEGGSLGLLLTGLLVPCSAFRYRRKTRR